MAGEDGIDRFERLSASFVDWLEQNGTTISSKIQIADLRSRSAGRGVVAKDDVEEGEELFSIPNCSILTVDTSSMPIPFKEAVDDPWLSLILTMVWEARQGSQSNWRAYIDVLPVEFDTLMYWSEQELEALKGSAVLDKIGKTSADAVFTERLLPIVRQHEAEFNAGTLSDDEILRLFHQMGSTIMAYAFDLENAPSQTEENEDGWEQDSDAGAVMLKGMVPLADMLNADADLNNAKLFYEDDKVVMKSIRPIPKGEELFNDYGPLPRADVLRRYGYITDNYTKYDVVEVSLELVKIAAKEQAQIKEHDVESRVRYLQEEGEVDDSYDICRTSNEEGPFSEELKMLINALSMATPDFDKLRKKGKLPKSELSSEALSLLSSVLIRRRSMYPPDKEINDQNGHNGVSHNGQREVMAAEVIKGEKQVLREAADTVHELLSGTTKRKQGDLEGEATIKDSQKRQRHSGIV